MANNFAFGIGSLVVSGGTQTQALSNLTFSNSPSVTFGLNGAILTASAAGGGGGVSVNFSAGTTSGNLDSVVFSNSNGVSFGLNGSTITASAVGGGGAVNFSAGTTSGNLTDVVFSNSNGISFGLNGSTITASHNALTSQSNQALSGSNGSFTFQTATFGSSNGMHFYTTNGSLVGSYTVPTVTNSSMTVSDAATSGTLARLAFTNLNGVTLSLSSGAGGSHTIVGSHNALTSQSNQALSAGNGSFTFQTASFSNANGISFSTTAGSAIIASHNGITSQSNQQITLFATSNTTQSSTGTSNVSSLIFAGAGIASVGITNGSILISVPSGGGAGDGGVFGGVSNLGNTAGSTGTVSTGNLVLVGSNGITLSQSTGAVGSDATISIFGETAPYASAYKNMVWLANSQSMTLGNSTSVMVPFIVNDERLSFTYFRNIQSVTVISTAIASTANANYSYSQGITFGLQVYRRNTGASSLSLVRVLETTAGLSFSIRVSRNTTNNYTITNGITFPAGIGTSTLSFSAAFTNSTDQISTSQLSVLTGVKFAFIPFASTLSQGKYFLLSGYSTTQTTQSTAILSEARLRFSYIVASQPNLAIAPFGNLTNAIYQMDYIGGPGSVSVVGGATTASLAMTQVSSSSSHNVPWFALELFD